MRLTARQSSSTGLLFFWRKEYKGSLKHDLEKVKRITSSHMIGMKYKEKRDEWNAKRKLCSGSETVD